MKYIKKFESEDWEKLRDYLKSTSKGVDRMRSSLNREQLVDDRSISDKYKHYFFDLTDEGWEYYVYKTDFYISLILRKDLLKSKAEGELENIVDRMNEIRGRLSDSGFDSKFLIYFNGVPQQINDESNPREVIFRYNGFDKDNNRRGSDDPTSFGARVEYTII